MYVVKKNNRAYWSSWAERVKKSELFSTTDEKSLVCPTISTSSGLLTLELHRKSRTTDETEIFFGIENRFINFPDIVFCSYFFSLKWIFLFSIRLLRGIKFSLDEKCIPNFFLATKFLELAPCTAIYQLKQYIPLMIRDQVKIYR